MDFKKQVYGYEKELIADLQTLLRIRSVEGEPEGTIPFGPAVQEALETTLNLGKSMGFTVKNVDNLAGHIEMGQGEDLIAILAHLDVVPEGKGWDHDPYGGEVVDGKIFGRGTIDDKGPAISALYAMKALKDAGVPLNKRVRLILGTNEETGWKGITHYFENEEHPTMGFSPDADFPAIHGEMGVLIMDFTADFKEKLQDGGIEVLSVIGGNAPNMVPDFAEARLRTNGKIIDHILEGYNKDRGDLLSMREENGDHIITCNGKSAHGSTPELGVNAIAHLLEFLNCLDLQIGDLTNFIRHYSRMIGLDVNGERIGVGFKDDYNKLVFNVGTINLNETHARLSINIRYPITMDLKAVLDGMAPHLKDAGWQSETLDHLAPIFMEPDHPLITNLMDVYTDITGDKRPPITIGGGTYARAAKNLVAFGPLFPGQEELAHQKNECIAVEDLMKCTHIYANALYKLTR